MSTDPTGSNRIQTEWDVKPPPSDKPVQDSKVQRFENLYNQFKNSIKDGNCNFNDSLKKLTKKELKSVSKHHKNQISKLGLDSTKSKTVGFIKSRLGWDSEVQQHEEFQSKLESALDVILKKEAEEKHERIQRFDHIRQLCIRDNAARNKLFEMTCFKEFLKSKNIDPLDVKEFTVKREEYNQIEEGKTKIDKRIFSEDLISAFFRRIGETLLDEQCEISRIIWSSNEVKELLGKHFIGTSIDTEGIVSVEVSFEGLTNKEKFELLDKINTLDRKGGHFLVTIKEGNRSKSIFSFHLGQYSSSGTINSDPKRNFELANQANQRIKGDKGLHSPNTTFNWYQLDKSFPGTMEAGATPKPPLNGVSKTLASLGPDDASNIGFSLVAGRKNKSPATQDRPIAGKFYVHEQMVLYAGVADGHLNDNTSEMIMNKLPSMLQASLQELPSLGSENDIVVVLEDLVANLQVDASYELIVQSQAFVIDPNKGGNQKPDGGSTLNLSLFIGDKTYTLNLGDSRAIAIAEDGTRIALSKDYNGDEEKIKSLGGGIATGSDGIRLMYLNASTELHPKEYKYVYSQGIATFGAIGDTFERPVERVPTITVCDTPKMVINACDGVFDFCSNEELLDQALSIGSRNPDITPEELSKKLVEFIYKNKYEGDDLTVVITFPKGENDVRGLYPPRKTDIDIGSHRLPPKSPEQAE